MSEFTPGPWMIDRFKGQPPYLIANETEVVCLLGNHERLKDDKREANARLIAAAPDLLAACIEAEQKFRVETETYKMLVAAIAKAGEGS